jgi:hypothetical protein
MDSSDVDRNPILNMIGGFVGLTPGAGVGLTLGEAVGFNSPDKLHLEREPREILRVSKSL